MAACSQEPPECVTREGGSVTRPQGQFFFRNGIGFHLVKNTDKSPKFINRFPLKRKFRKYPNSTSQNNQCYRFYRLGHAQWQIQNLKPNQPLSKRNQVQAPQRGWALGPSRGARPSPGPH